MQQSSAIGCVKNVKKISENGDRCFTNFASKDKREITLSEIIYIKNDDVYDVREHK